MKAVFVFLFFCIFISLSYQQTWKVLDITSSSNVPITKIEVAILNQTSILVVAENGSIYQAIQQNALYDWITQDLTKSSGAPTTSLPISIISSGPWPKLQFVCVDNTNDHVVLGLYYLSQPIWTFNDQFKDPGVPTTKLPLTTVNNLEYAVIGENNDINTVSYDPSSSYFSIYDLASTANIPKSDVPISILFNVYPNIQLLSIDSSTNNVIASYFNQPTNSGWAVYDLTKQDNIPRTKTEIAVASGSQFFVVDLNNNINNCLYGDGEWTVTNMASAQNVPQTNLPITILYSNPIQFAMVDMNGHVNFVYFSYNTGEWSVFDMTATNNFPTTSVRVTAVNDNRVMIVSNVNNHVYFAEYS